MRTDKKSSQRTDKKAAPRSHKQGVVGYSKKSALLEDAITQMNAGKYGRSSAALKELLALDPLNMEARRLFATLHLRLGSLIPARQAFESLINEAFERQDYWLAESLLREYLAAGPRCVPFLDKLGTIYQDKGDMLAAVTEYGKAIDILIEDPDPEHPQLASQFYAKVRELAPASPVAFRLAAFFDAQSGELIARPKPSQPESVDGTTGGPAPVHDALQSSPVPSSSDERRLVSGSAASSERSIEFAAVIADSFPNFPLGETGVDCPAELVAPEQSSAEASRPNLAASEVSVDSTAEGSVHGHTGSILAEPAAGQLPADPSTMDPSTAPLPADPSATLAVTSFSGSASTETVELSHRELRLADPAPSGFDTRSSEEREQANSGSLSAPMPWERVENSAIAIPEPEIDASPQITETADSARDSGNVESQSPGDGSPEKTGDPSSSVSAQALSGLTSEGQKKEGFSWESVFSRAWNLGGAPSSLDQKDDTPNVEIEPAKNSETSAAPPAVEHQTPIQPDISLRAGEEAGSPPSPESAAAPMPWDQVQDATVRIIPPKEAELPTPATAAAGATVPPATWESGIPDSPSAPHDVAQPEIAPASVPAGMEPGTFSSVEAAPPTGTGGTAFRLVEELPVSPVDQSMAAAMGADASVSESASFPADPADSRTAVVLEPDTVVSHPVASSLDPVVQFHEQPIESPEPPVGHLAPAPPAETVLETPQLRNEDASTSASKEPGPAALTHDQPPAPEQPVHWKTGEVAVQTHRPAPKKRKRSSASEAELPEVAPSVEEQAQADPEPTLHQEPPAVEPPLQNDVAAQEPEAWASAGDSIRFVDPSVSTVERPAVPAPSWEGSSPAQPVAAAVSAVDVLFDSTQRTGRAQAQERVSRKSRFRLGALLNRIRISLFVFLRSCFSTTRAIVTTIAALAVASAAMLVLVIGAVAMAWLAMEEKPAPAYQSLTTVPQRLLMDSKNNGYLLLLGFEAPPSADPVQAGYERKPDGKDADLTAGCVGGRGSGNDTSSAQALQSWFGASDPAAQLRRNQDMVKALANRSEPALGRYRQWLKMRFEDWGYGQSMSPPCAAILSAHRLFVADGFTQHQLDAGIDRLEADMEAWRATLSQARTLPVKTMALQAINDDIAVASGLLVRPESDGPTPDRLAKMLRPLDQMELSLRWPMQSQFVVATKTLEARLKADRSGPMPLHVRIASALPLPKQRRFNDYAKYYEASYKAAGEGRFGSLPKRANYLWSPPKSLIDIMRNPLENLIGLEPLAEWEFYSGLVVDTDARLRLASLQVWLRRAPPGANLMAQIAKAGQSLYDPYTGYPMLVNLGKGVIYSVGHDGRDQDAHPQADVVAAIPPGILVTARNAPSSPGPR